MKKEILFLIAALVLVTASLLAMARTAPPSNVGAKAATTVQKVYVCEKCEVVADKPGKCPKCGMDLVPAAGKGK